MRVLQYRSGKSQLGFFPHQAVDWRYPLRCWDREPRAARFGRQQYRPRKIPQIHDTVQWQWDFLRLRAHWCIWTSSWDPPPGQCAGRSDYCWCTTTEIAASLDRYRMLAEDL